MKDKQILEELLKELKALNKHFDNIEAEKISEMIYTHKVAMAQIPEPYKSEEEQEKEEELKRQEIKECWGKIRNPFLSNYQKNMVIKKLEELTGKKINELTE